jgi:hypothetical protein
VGFRERMIRPRKGALSPITFHLILLLEQKIRLQTDRLSRKNAIQVT